MIRALTFAAALMAAAPAAAEPHRQTIAYRPVDLASERGAERLVRRIEAAALEACGAGPRSLPAVRRAVVRSACWQEATAEAVARLDSPRVTAAHEGRRRGVGQRVASR